MGNVIKRGAIWAWSTGLGAAAGAVLGWWGKVSESWPWPTTIMVGLIAMLAVMGIVTLLHRWWPHLLQPDALSERFVIDEYRKVTAENKRLETRLREMAEEYDKLSRREKLSSDGRDKMHDLFDEMSDHADEARRQLAPALRALNDLDHVLRFNWHAVTSNGELLPAGLLTPEPTAEDRVSAATRIVTQYRQQPIEPAQMTALTDLLSQAREGRRAKRLGAGTTASASRPEAPSPSEGEPPDR